MPCKKHLDATYRLEKTKTGFIKRCRKCTSERVHKSRKLQLKKLKIYFGGKCIECGYNKYLEVLDFHHINPNTKEFALSDNRSGRSFVRMLQEAKKCELLCCRCHREKHIKIEKLGI